MLETQAEITVLLGHIARVDVVVLIPRERIAMSGKRELYPKNGNQKQTPVITQARRLGAVDSLRVPHSGAICR